MTTTDTPTVEVRNLPHLDAAQEDAAPPVEAPAPDQEPEAAQEDDGAKEKAPANREVRYRVERNEARAQVAELTERIGRMQETEAVRLAADLLANPGDLVLFGYMPDLVGEDGMVDPEKVTAAAKELIAARPGFAKGAGVDRSSRRGGFGQGRRPMVDGGSGTTWGSVLRGQ